jgi:hypothetical protein
MSCGIEGLLPPSPRGSAITFGRGGSTGRANSVDVTLSYRLDGKPVAIIWVRR